MNTKEIGKMGEEAAAKYLEENDYEIIHMNYGGKSGEIDIVAMSPEEVCVFVEVKTRQNTDFGRACEAVDYKKQEKIIRTAMMYNYNGDMRFDVIEVYYSYELDFNVTEINHIENAFQA